MLDHSKRINIIRATLHGSGFLISDPMSISYISGFHPSTPPHKDAFAVITENNVYLCTYSLYREEAQTFSNLCTICIIDPLHPLTYHLKTICENEKINKLWFEEHAVTYFEYNRLLNAPLPLVPAEITIEKIREVKDKNEIQALRKACALTNNALLYLTHQLKIGTTEKYASYLLEDFIRKNGYEPGFVSIIAYDAHASQPHHVNSDKPLNKNSVILIDCGAKVDGYNADITRMFFGKSASKEFISLYQQLKTIQEKTISYIPDATTGADIDSYCRELYKKSGLPNFFHATGHGVGLDIHELPKIAPKSQDLIKPHQVITVEPGIYVEGKYGMRLEDTILIGNGNKPACLTQFSKEVFILDL